MRVGGHSCVKYILLCVETEQMGRLCYHTHKRERFDGEVSKFVHASG